MPTYDYQCKSCGHEMEVFHSMSATPTVDCPECDTSGMKKQLGTGAGIIFKGSGFYETDFKDKKGAKPGESKTGDKKDASTDSSPKAEKPKEPTKPAPKKPKKDAAA